MVHWGTVSVNNEILGFLDMRLNQEVLLMKSKRSIPSNESASVSGKRRLCGLFPAH